MPLITTAAIVVVNGARLIEGGDWKLKVRRLIVYKSRKVLCSGCSCFTRAAMDGHRSRLEDAFA